MRIPQVLFILGSGHSGSTLLDLLLDSHSKVIGIGELVSEDSDPTSDPFWRDILPKGELFDVARSKSGFLFGSKNYRYAKTGKAVDIAQYRERVRTIYTKAAATKGASVVVDSSKNADYTELMCRALPDPVIVHVVRDGRGVFSSYLRKYGAHVWFSLSRWFFMNAKVELLRRRVKARYLFLRYEELVAHPQESLARILEAVGLSYEPAMLSFRAFPHHQISGNRMKGEASEKIELDESWKENLSWTRQLAFNLAFGWLNFLYKRRRSL